MSPLTRASVMAGERGLRRKLHVFLFNDLRKQSSRRLARAASKASQASDFLRKLTGERLQEHE